MNIPQIPQKAQYKDVKKRTIEILQRARIFKANCNVHVCLIHAARDQDRDRDRKPLFSIAPLPVHVTGPVPVPCRVYEP